MPHAKALSGHANTQKPVSQLVNVIYDMCYSLSAGITAHIYQRLCMLCDLLFHLILPQLSQVEQNIAIIFTFQAWPDSCNNLDIWLKNGNTQPSCHGFLINHVHGLMSFYEVFMMREQHTCNGQIIMCNHQYIKLWLGFCGNSSHKLSRMGWLDLDAAALINSLLPVQKTFY